MNVIEARDITKRYGDVHALNGIDVTVAPGEIVGFLGPNGAGKTTAISVMLGLRKPTSGTARLFGRAPDDRHARGRTGVMLQESGVPFSLRVEEVIGLFQSYYPFTLPIDELLRRADLADKRRSLIADLSGGQKQRLYFALALAGDPDLLFLDEPTVGMDVETRVSFWEQAREFARTRIPALIRPEALKRLRLHRSQGDRVVIVTASFPEWIEPWAETEGVTAVLGSRVESREHRLTGRQDGPNCHGPEKVRRLLAEFPDRKAYRLFAYGDSRGDRELLAAADEAYFRRFS